MDTTLTPKGRSPVCVGRDVLLLPFLVSHDSRVSESTRGHGVWSVTVGEGEDEVRETPTSPLRVSGPLSHLR